MWIVLLLSSLSPAHASSARAALDQLDEEIRVLVDKNAWQGVERVYIQMLPLEARGAKMTWKEHQWGALAAQSRGDVLATWHRLRAAEAVESHPETLTWLATLEATHGRAVVELSPLVFGEVTLESLDPVVDPAAQRTIALAGELLNTDRTFDGLLPLGRYRIGAVTFGIDGGPLVKVRVEPGQGRGKTAAAPAGTVRLVVGATFAHDADFVKAAEAAKGKAAGVAGVAGVELVPLPPPRLYADFARDSLSALGLTPSVAAEQIRAALGLRAEDVLPGPDSVSVPVAVGTARLGGVSLAFDGGAMTVSALARVREAGDRNAPPPGLLVRLAPDAAPDTVRAAVLAALSDSPLQLTTP